jgi:hypothetical protein
MKKNLYNESKCRSIRSTSLFVTALFLTGLLSGCDAFDGDGNNDNSDSVGEEQAQDPQTNSYRITVSNQTNNQPFSPIAVIIHDGSYSVWQIGDASSAGLEMLAESGDSSQLLQEASEAGMTTTGSGDGAFGAGEESSVELEVDVAHATLSIVAMLVNTNDAFTGTNDVDLSGLEVGGSLSRELAVYDAGTEYNDEIAGSIPGPADGGEGFNEARNDLDKVSRHPGVASIDGSNQDSALDQSHRFDAPVGKLIITRIK